MINKIELSKIKEVICSTYDVFICSSSFEERCLSISNNIDVSIFSEIWLIHNICDEQSNQIHTKMLSSIFGERAKLIEISLSNPLITADRIHEKIVEITNNKSLNSILIDITTFTHESLLILIKLLNLKCPNTKVTCIYANATEYSVGDDNKHKWLSNGIGEIRSVLGYAGNIIPSQKTHLIMIVGYESERAVSIINAIEPNSLALGYGCSSNATTDKNKEANEYYLHLIEEMTTSYSNIITFEIPCDDPLKITEELKKQIENEKDKNIIIVPMNNKLSTIGVALLAIENDDIQICYAPALTYNYQNYSTPGTNCYIYEL